MIKSRGYSQIHVVTLHTHQSIHSLSLLHAVVVIDKEHALELSQSIAQLTVDVHTA